MTPASVHDCIVDGKRVLVHGLKNMSWHHCLKDELTTRLSLGNHAAPLQKPVRHLHGEYTLRNRYMDVFQGVEMLFIVTGFFFFVQRKNRKKTEKENEFEKEMPNPEARPISEQREMPCSFVCVFLPLSPYACIYLFSLFVDTFLCL